MVIIPDLLLILTLIAYLVLVRLKKVGFRLTALALWLGIVLLVDTIITYSKIDLGAFFHLYAGHGDGLLASLLSHHSQRQTPPTHGLCL
jgi:O-antigen ligase